MRRTAVTGLFARPVGISVHVVIQAPGAAVWSELEHLERHVSWMRDAVAIRFEGDQHRGLGTRFACDTRIGPIRLCDQMEVTEWVEGRTIAVRHTGLVTGEGRFELVATSEHETRLSWDEQLSFPAHFGGTLGAWAARPVLTRIWQSSLFRFRRIVEASD